MIDQQFRKSNKFHIIFNKNTVKISYSCTQRMPSIIKCHNQQFINKDVKELKPCNCKVKSECSLNCHCQVTEIIIYKSTKLSPEKPNKLFLGTAKSDLKKRFYNHRKSFNDETSANDTIFSKCIWEIKKTSTLNPTLVWSIAKLPPYSNISKKCPYIWYSREKTLTLIYFARRLLQLN